MLKFLGRIVDRFTPRFIRDLDALSDELSDIQEVVVGLGTTVKAITAFQKAEEDRLTHIARNQSRTNDHVERRMNENASLYSSHLAGHESRLRALERVRDLGPQDELKQAMEANKPTMEVVERLNAQISRLGVQVRDLTDEASALKRERADLNRTIAKMGADLATGKKRKPKKIKKPKRKAR